MENSAMIGGRVYRFVEYLDATDGSGQYVVCADSDGVRYVCPAKMWQANVIADTAQVNRSSSSKDKIDLFLDLFRGREDVYARRWYSPKTDKSGYAPVCRNEWREGICNKRKYKCAECPNREFAPLTSEVVRAHLLGRDELCRDVAAIYPMLPDDTTRILAMDFDGASWKADVSAVRKVCEGIGLAPAVERSRSGDGAHIWFFFSEPVKAADARKLGTSLLTRAMGERHELSFTSYDRLFPAQDFLPKGGFGNLIALPFQGRAQREGNTLFVDGGFEPYPDQWAFLSSLPRLSAGELEQLLSELKSESDVGPLLDAESARPWPEKRTRRKLTREDFPLSARLMLANALYIDKAGFTSPALNAVKRLAAFPNPEFRQKQAMRLPVRGVPRIISCADEDQDFLALPRGCAEAVTELLDEYNVPYSLEDRRNEGRPIDATFTGALRPEQEPAAEALLREDTGVLSATTAFGKTVIGAYLIGQRKVNTLILVNSTALLGQWREALEKFLTINEPLPEEPKKRGRKKIRRLIGQIGGGKDTRGGVIDIALMQSLFEGDEREVKPFVASYGMVIADECHHIAAFTFEKVMKSVQAKYVYGLSATPVRKDGHQPIIFMQCGPVRYIVDAKSQAEKRAFSHFVIPRFTRTRLPAINGIQDAYEGIVENDTRNDFIISDALSAISEGRTPILLTERKEHAAVLASGLQGKVQNVILLIGSTGQKEKREKLAALQNVPQNETLAVVATGRYIGEGFDAPRLDTLLLTMPVSWKGTLAQYAGRLHRSYEGKREVRIYDYVDAQVPILERMYHKRLRGYAELGYEVKLGGRDDAPCVIYTGNEYIEPITADLASAAREIVISSPYIQKNRVKSLLPLLTATLATVYTAPPESYKPEYQGTVAATIALLESSGVTVIRHPNLTLRLAVIDKSLVWYGDINPLAFPARDADAIRFDNSDIAGELLDTLAGTGEQLGIEEL